MIRWAKENPWKALAVAALLCAVWMGRYTIAGSARAAHRLDRWTGDVAHCVAGDCE